MALTDAALIAELRKNDERRQQVLKQRREERIRSKSLIRNSEGCQGDVQKVPQSAQQLLKTREATDHESRLHRLAGDAALQSPAAEGERVDG